MTSRLVDAALDRLAALHPRLIDLSLERMHRLLEALGHPERRLPPVIHVAGTNGKGSTVASLRAMAEAEGLRVHAYTSPHLVRFNERIRLAGRLIDDDALMVAIDRVEAANAGRSITQFEITTAVAFQAFAETPADLLLLEVGLGGVLDATNVIAAPALSIITPVDVDHREFLGDTLTAIAREKAGILKTDVPAVIARQAEDALEVIEARAEAVRAPLTIVGRDADAWAERGRLVVQATDRLLDLPLPSLAGPHQVDNAGVAVLAALAMGWSEAAIERGLSAVRWPARMQRLTAGPHAAAMRDRDGELWLDGGHNPHAAQALAATLGGLQVRDPRPLTVIVGMLANKDAAGFFHALAGLDAAVITVPFAGAIADPAALADAARDAGLRASAMPDLTAALKAVTGERPRLVICGSLHLAGEVLAASPETWPV